MYVAIGEASRETYVIGETQAEVMRKLFEEYPYVSADKNVYPERLSIVQKEPRTSANEQGKYWTKKLKKWLTKESIPKWTIKFKKWLRN